MILDSHCHLDRFPDPKAAAADAVRRGVFTIAVTNLPSHFRVGLPHVRSLPQIRLALGYHPLAIHNFEERKMFSDLFHLTSFIGEVGLDFSREGKKDTRDSQLADFRFIAETVAQTPKVVSLHSRGAEAAVLDILIGTNLMPVIFHWYSGPLGVLDEAVLKGHYFSVNPSMVHSEKGKRVIARIPPDRLLTETDGPYVRIGRVPAKPGDVILVENYMASLWAIRPDEVRDRIWSNFGQLLNRLGLGLRS